MDVLRTHVTGMHCGWIQALQDRLARVGVALYVREQGEFMELCLGTAHGRVKGLNNTGVGYQLPDQEEMDQAAFRQWEEASHS